MTAAMDMPSILIADDDPGCRDALREIFEPQGYETFLAESAEEALEIIHQQRIHLALLDLHMKKMTGLEAVQIVHTINAQLPCILVTADATEDIVRQAFRVQVYSVIPKPVSRNIVLYTVVRALAKTYGQGQSAPKE